MKGIIAWSIFHRWYSLSIYANSDSFQFKIKLKKQNLMSKTLAWIRCFVWAPNKAHLLCDIHSKWLYPISGYVSPQAPPTCDICQMIILGHVFAGYLCLTCKKVYHENCFIEGVPDQELIAKMSKFFDSWIFFVWWF